MPLASKLNQVLIVLQLEIGRPLQTPLRHLNIHIDILDQTLLAHIIVLRSYKPTNEQIHPRTVEILLELVENVHFLQ